MTTPAAFPDFVPPGCPHPRCEHYAKRQPPECFRFLRRYHTRGFTEGIPLYRCVRGEHTFSLRRFSCEFYLHKPERTAWLTQQLTSCVSLRQTARHQHGLSTSSIERRIVRFGKQAHLLLRLALRALAPLPGEFVLDEAETFERHRLMAPLTVAALVHRKSRFALAAHVATLAPRIRRGHRRWSEKQLRDLVSGFKPRRNESRKAVGRVLEKLVRVAAPGLSVLLSDEKKSYRPALRRLDPTGAIAHRTFPSPGSKHPRHPLFAINHLLAMIRDALARMRRRTWCHSKSRLWLWWLLGIYLVWKNFVRPRFNGERKSAAQRAGLTRRRWRVEDLFAWRQDLGAISIRPFARSRPKRASNP